jgi:hypothetical protein
MLDVGDQRDRVCRRPIDMMFLACNLYTSTKQNINQQSLRSLRRLGLLEIVQGELAELGQLLAGHGISVCLHTLQHLNHPEVLQLAQRPTLLNAHYVPGLTGIVLVMGKERFLLFHVLLREGGYYWLYYYQ